MTREGSSLGLWMKLLGTLLLYKLKRLKAEPCQLSLLYLFLVEVGTNLLEEALTKAG